MVHEIIYIGGGFTVNQLPWLLDYAALAALNLAMFPIADVIYY